ncbi:MAG: hypothetical protein JWR61_4502 [Ferruginibacter sp.]|nr:hypothetical protein [Ferruginibacter sp.]
MAIKIAILIFYIYFGRRSYQIAPRDLFKTWPGNVPVQYLFSYEKRPVLYQKVLIILLHLFALRQNCK